MRDRVGALGTRPGKVKGAGGDSDKLPCGLEGAQGESPCPSSRTHMPVDDVDGTSQNEELSTEVKNALSEVGLSLHSGNKALPCLKESLRRSSAPAAAQSKTVDLSCAPAGEHCAGVSCWGGGALARGWPGGGPRASDSTEDRATKENLGGQDYRAFRNGQKWGFRRRKRQMLF